MDETRWEHGSKFHWMEPQPPAEVPERPWGESGTYWGTGRYAMRALLAWGAERHDWSRLRVPSFYCQKVTGALDREAPEVVPYLDEPGSQWVPPERFRPDDVLLVPNTFGLRSEPDYADVPDDVVVFEDHTHDPWSNWARESGADWAIAGLRKTLPVPDGAVLWSPQGREVPSTVVTTDDHRGAAHRMMAGMVMKARYLRGGRVAKGVFLETIDEAESALGRGELSGITDLTDQVLADLPVEEWRATRRANWKLARRRFDDDGDGWGVLEPEDVEDSAPFALVCVFEEADERDRVRQALIDRDIYPAHLWPLDDPAVEGIPASTVDLSERIFCIHCDMRYDSEDMERVAGAVADVVSET